MRHQVSGYRLRKDEQVHVLHCVATLSNNFLCTSVFRPHAPKRTRSVVMLNASSRIARNSASGDDAQKVHARRLAISKLGDNQVIKRLFDEIAPRFANRPGGYTRILKLGPRMGDAAEMVILELVEE